SIFVPEIADPAKIQRISELGAELRVGGALYADALKAAEAFAAETGAKQIHAFDQPETLIGQGSVGLELEQQAPGLNTVLVAVGGGGLIGGIAAWFQGRVKIVSVEPETAAALKAAMDAGAPTDVDVSGIAADSLGASRVGRLAFPLCQSFVEETVLVTDDDIKAAQAVLWQSTRLVAEPGGAAALAALISGAYKPGPDERVGVIICGANTRTLPGV
ncbi:MAG: pyridoxal-phosphate dependent enzyme, partial [Pseudomonadota bacterium]